MIYSILKSPSKLRKLECKNPKLLTFNYKRSKSWMLYKFEVSDLQI